MTTRSLRLLIALSAMVALVLSVALYAGSPSKGGIVWIKYDLAVEKAKKENKHLLVDFMTQWCGYCKKMDATTYKDTGVVNLINRHFVPAVVDGDSYNVLKLKEGDKTEKGLTREFGVTGYPTTWFLEPDGKKIGPAPGYIDAKQLLIILDYIRTNANDKMTFKEFVEQRTFNTSAKP